MIFPFVGNYRVTRKFGVFDPVYKNYPGSRHPGTDWNLGDGVPLRAAHNGIVKIYNRPASIKVGRGKEVSIVNLDGIQVNTCHMSRIDAKDGQTVQAGDPIGLSGYTGYTLDTAGNIGTPAAAHLHAEVIIRGQYVDPEQYFKDEEESMFTNAQTDEFISLAYNLVAGRPPKDSEFKFHREQFEKQGDIWAITMLKGFDNNNDVAWKKNNEYIPVGELFVKKG